MTRIPVIMIYWTSAFAKKSLRVPDALFVSCGCLFELARNGASVACPPRQRRFIIAVAANAVLEKQHAIDLLWGEDPDGGPEAIDKSLGKVAYEARTAAAALGLAIDKEPFGWRLRAIPGHRQ